MDGHFALNAHMLAEHLSLLLSVELRSSASLATRRYPSSVVDPRPDTHHNCKDMNPTESPSVRARKTEVTGPPSTIASCVAQWKRGKFSKIVVLPEDPSY
jgi:hypothetical protein